MIAAPAKKIDAIDQIDQVIDELVTIWLALGNSTDMADDYVITVREALNGTTNRLRDAMGTLIDKGGVS
ncbi:hypothetical protein [Mesorhizobium sp. KR1-2]|uniref:hypothetical protein n=1 Tax=Mesorhizobium sp. KR1-2 TaxID=3156609 RepID=UPI0032B42E3E